MSFQQYAYARAMATTNIQQNQYQALPGPPKVPSQHTYYNSRIRAVAYSMQMDYPMSAVPSIADIPTSEDMVETIVYSIGYIVSTCQRTPPTAVSQNMYARWNPMVSTGLPSAVLRFLLVECLADTGRVRMGLQSLGHEHLQQQ